MNCPFCKNPDTRVIDKRDTYPSVTRRRRECERCSKRFTTYERIENICLNVEKRDGRVEEFNREKIKRGIMKAVSKRNISEEKIEALISDIEQNLLNNEKQVIKTTEIGEMVLKGLTKIDKLGALLFASVYKEFETLKQVQKELERLGKRN